MFGRPAGYRAWPGRKQVNARLEPELYQAVMREARKQNLSKAELARRIFLKWYENGIKVPDVAASVNPPPVPSIPQTKRAREDTGRSEPVATLQAIDVAREEAKDSGDTFAD